MSDDEYEYVKGTFRYKKGSTPDRSRETDGAWRGTTRDADGVLDGHGEFLPGDDDGYDSDRSYTPDDYYSYSSDESSVMARNSNDEVARESEPDIANLVPIALVAFAGIAAGVAGVKIAQSRKRRREQERMAIAANHAVPSAAPPGWYETASDPGRLRYWSGAGWTNEFAQRAVASPAIAADWYPDPSNANQLRYWDGNAWTHHTSQLSGAVATPADWYPDPSNPAQLRYWDGHAWTAHVASGQGSAVAAQGARTPANEHDLVAFHERQRIDMTTAEWQAHVEGWARAGAIQQELWSRLTNARITDGDDRVISAQRQWEALTPQEGAHRIRLMLEADPSLRSQDVLVEFVRLFGNGQPMPRGVEGAR